MIGGRCVNHPARVEQQPHPEPAQQAHGEHRADEDHAGHALGVLGREQEAALRAPRQRDAHRAVDAAGVHHVERVLRELALVVRRGSVGRSERPLPRGSKQMTRK